MVLALQWLASPYHENRDGQDDYCHENLKRLLDVEIHLELVSVYDSI